MSEKRNEIIFNLTKKVLKGSVEMLMLCDKALNIIYINPTLKRQYPLLGKKFGLNDMFNKHELDEIAISVSKGKSINVEGKSKEYFINYLQFSVSPLFNHENTVIGCIVLVKDTYFFKDYTFNEEKTSIINAVSQEMKHPLTMIFTCLDLIKKNLGENTNEKINKYINEVNNNSFKLLRFVNHLIEIIELKENTGKLKYQEWNICEQLSKTHSAFVKYLKGSKIKLSLKLPKDDIRICYDAEKIERVFLNITITAIKHLPKSGEIDISLQDDDDYIKVITKIKNIQRKEELLNNEIEYNFFRYDKLNDEDKNILGIYLVKSIVIKHGGTIHFIEKNTNQMSIEFTLPKRKSNELTSHQYEKYSNSDLINQINEEMSILS